MLEELLDRKVCWYCLQPVGNVLFWDTHSSFPKSHIWQRHSCSRCFTTAVASLLVEFSEHVPGFPSPLYNSSEAEHSKFVQYVGFICLPYSTSGFSYHRSQALLSMLRVIDSGLELQGLQDVKCTDNSDPGASHFSVT